MKRQFDRDFFIGWIVILAFAVVFFTDGLNTITYRMIAFDDGYNATVAANLMRYGQYRVSYPAFITFYNVITTGETVLLPTALLYRLFGINAVTSAIVPLFYAVGSIFAAWILLAICLRKAGTVDAPGRRSLFDFSYTLSALLVVLTVLADGWFGYVSTALLGEVASIFFLLISFIGIAKHYETGKNLWLLLSGAMLMASFLTKTATIFFVVSCVGIVLIETLVTRTIRIKGGLCYLLGMALGFGILETYKYSQLGSLPEYLLWWQNEWLNMTIQSSGIDTSYSIPEKVTFLGQIFTDCSSIACLIMILAPVLCYAFLALRGLAARIKKQGNAADGGLLTMAIAGTSAASLEVYFVLLGGSGLVNARRHEVNEFIVKLFIAYAILRLGGRMYKFLKQKASEKEQVKKAGPAYGIFASIAVCLAMISLAFPATRIVSNAGGYLAKKTDYDYDAKLMYELLDEIAALPENSVFVANCWWQEPNVTLYQDRIVYSIDNYLGYTTDFPEDSYMIVGSQNGSERISDIEAQFNIKLTKIDTSETDYAKLGKSKVDGEIELFSIYQVEGLY